MKTSELIGPALDWAVAIARGWKRYDSPCMQDDGRLVVTLMLDEGTGCMRVPESYAPSSNWAQGGPIIEREKFLLAYEEFKSGRYEWQAVAQNEGPLESGPTPLIAAMRCYVASKLGDEVDIPEEFK